MQEIELRLMGEFTVESMMGRFASMIKAYMTDYASKGANRSNQAMKYLYNETNHCIRCIKSRNLPNTLIIRMLRILMKSLKSCGANH